MALNRGERPASLRTCLYFAMAVAPAIAYDTAKPTPLLLYVGETERSPFTAMDEPLLLQLHRQLHRTASAPRPSMWLWVSTYAPNSTLASRMQRLTGKPTAADQRES